MLKVILNRPNPELKNRLCSEAGEAQQMRSSVSESCIKSTFNISRICTMFSQLSKKHLTGYGCSLINSNLARAIKHLYDNAISAFQMNGSTEKWFRTAVGVRQGCCLSSILFNIVRQMIMSDALEEHDGKVNIGGRTITNQWFADKIDAHPEKSRN